MFWICEWFDRDGRLVLGRNNKFLLFKRKKNAIAYFIEQDACFGPDDLAKITLEEAKELFEKYEYEII